MAASSFLKRLTPPASSYQDAMGRLATLQAAEGNEIGTLCRTYALTHDRTCRQVVVLFHGYTNCPHQFRQLATAIHLAGHNLLVPRMPFHGLVDRMAPDLAKLTAGGLVECLEEALDIAHGLGDIVTVGGLSGGAILAAWAAQFRGDVQRVIMAAPTFGLPFLPPVISDGVKAVMQHMPNMFVWWDARTKERLNDIPHAYPRWATHGLCQFMRLGDMVRREAKVTPPAARELVVISNASDVAVNNRIIYGLIRDWERLAPGRVQSCEFSKEQAVLHDMIDPAQKLQKIEIVYPVWLQYINQPELSPEL
jgi:pimeloyl-ACP methyl ester carboxylesterase